MLHCRECGSRLAHDQRYCLSCGARRGALPAHIFQLIGGILQRERAAAAAEPLEDPLSTGSGRFDAWLVAPRAAAVAVMGMLGFGVVVGSLIGESAASDYQPVIVAVGPHGSSSGAPGGGVGGPLGAAGAGGGGVTTITVGSTTPTPAVASAAPASPTPTSPVTGGNSAPVASALPPIKHVFLIMLSNQGYHQTFGHTTDDPYLASTLAGKGELVENYYSVAGGSLANEIALMSGQGPTQDTVDNCPLYTNVVPGKKGARGQVLGNGCVYPVSTPTLAQQLTAAHLTWKAYVQATGSGGQAHQEACRHPKLDSPDTQPSSGGSYATYRNPFLYFHSLIDRTTCPKNDASIAQLATDLRAKDKTPALSYLIPDLCHDGSDSPCAPGAPSGMAGADTFLKSVVPEIERSAAYKDGGLIAITFDQAPQSGTNADSSSCCNNPTYPTAPVSSGASGAGASTTSTTTTSTGTTTTGAATTSPSTTPASGSTTTTGTTTTSTTSTSPTCTSTTPTSTSTTPTSTSTTPTSTSTTPTSTSNTPTCTSTTPNSLLGGQTNPTGGGGQVGLLLLSQYVKPGMIDVTDYFNHFSLLASIEDLFALKRLAYASDRALPVFGAAVYTNYTPGG